MFLGQVIERFVLTPLFSCLLSERVSDAYFDESLREKTEICDVNPVFLRAR